VLGFNCSIMWDLLS